MENEQAVAVNNLCHLNSGQCNGRIRSRPRGVKSQGAARKEREQRQGACPPSLVGGYKKGGRTVPFSRLRSAGEVEDLWLNERVIICKEEEDH